MAQHRSHHGHFLTVEHPLPLVVAFGGPGHRGGRQQIANGLEKILLGAGFVVKTHHFDIACGQGLVLKPQQGQDLLSRVAGGVVIVGHKRGLCAFQSFPAGHNGGQLRKRQYNSARVFNLRAIILSIKTISRKPHQSRQEKFSKTQNFSQY